MALRGGSRLWRRRSCRRVPVRGAVRISVLRRPGCAHLSASALERAERGDACGFSTQAAHAHRAPHWWGGWGGGGEEVASGGDE